MNVIIILNLVISAFMFGLILTTQVVSYPMFLFADKDNFSTYHTNYVKYISIVVIPLMLLEFIISILLFSLLKDFLFTVLLFINIVILLTTYFIQVPIHDNLGREFNKRVIKKLIKTNWIRTLMWFIKVFLSVLIILKENIK